VSKSGYDSEVQLGSPAARVIAVSEYESLTHKSLIWNIANKAISAILFIVVIFMIHEKYERILVEYLCYVSLFSNVLWIGRIIVNVLEERRAARRLDLIDRGRYSTDWEDKFVGIYRSSFNINSRTMVEVYEPVLWLMSFALMLKVSHSL
jgi:hypothetical protein